MSYFRIGDTVRLKSGGPIMTVVKDSGFGRSNNVECSWFVNGTVCNGSFPTDSLDEATPEKPKSN